MRSPIDGFSVISHTYEHTSLFCRLIRPTYSCFVKCNRPLMHDNNALFIGNVEVVHLCIAAPNPTQPNSIPSIRYY